MNCTNDFAQVGLAVRKRYEPASEAHFVGHPAVTAIHQSGEFLAFASRSNELILKNLKTGGCTLALPKDSHRILQLLFTNSYLLVVRESLHEILVVSLRSGRVKKKLAVHRGQVTRLAYNRLREIVVSVSNEECVIFKERTLSILKKLVVRTSDFHDCLCTEDGQFLFTSFKDGTACRWHLETFECSHLSTNKLGNLAAGSTGHLFLHDRAAGLAVTSYTGESFVLQPLPVFWGGQLAKVLVMDSRLLVLSSTGLYWARMKETHQMSLDQFGSLPAVSDVAVAEYGELLMLLSEDCKLFQLMQWQAVRTKLKASSNSNPLTNLGLTCAGGYNGQQGCHLTLDLLPAVAVTTAPPPASSNNPNPPQQIQQIEAGNYCDALALDCSKLKAFVEKHHVLPDRHRPAVYRYLLALPISPQQFLRLEHLGLHDSTKLLDARYPLADLNLSARMKQVVSVLAHLHPVLGEADCVPAIVFPFVCLFGADVQLCVDLLYRLFSCWLGFLFEEFPMANTRFLLGCREVLAKDDPEILAHLDSKGLSFTRLAWSLLSNFFTCCLPREAFLAVIDGLFSRPDRPQLVMFVLLGFIATNRARLLSVRSCKELDAFLEQEQTVHTAKFMAHVHRLAAKYHSQAQQLDWPMANLSVRSYSQSGGLSAVPKQAVAMYVSRRELQVEELGKCKQQEQYKDNMLEGMQGMEVRFKRQTERELIKKQAFQLLCQKEENRLLCLPEMDRTSRVKTVERLIDQLTALIQAQGLTREQQRVTVPAYAQLVRKSDTELDELEAQLTALLIEYRPTSFQDPIVRQPFAMRKEHPNSQQNFKGAVNARMAEQLWGLDSLEHKQQAIRWENGMLRALP